MKRSPYKLRHTFDDNLNIVTEMTAFVVDNRSSTWLELNPDHYFNNYDQRQAGAVSVWSLADF